MDYNSIDCFILKFIRAYPFVSPYVYLTNIWAFELDINLKTCEIEVSNKNILLHQNKMLEFYNIKKLYITDSIDNYLKKDKKIILNCDAFRLPYSPLYKKVHIEHYVLVEDIRNNKYKIYDDFPYYEGEIDKSSLLKANNSFNINKFIFQYFDDSEAKKNIPLKPSLKYMYDNIDSKYVRTRFFMNKLNEIDISNLKKMDMLADVKFRSIISRYNSIYKILYNISIDCNSYIDINKIDSYIEEFKQYMKLWVLIINLCEKGRKLQKEIFWEKIEIKIKELNLYEVKICEIIDDIKNIIKSYIGE